MPTKAIVRELESRQKVSCGRLERYLQSVRQELEDFKRKGARGFKFHLAYMRDLFCLLPSWPKNRVLQLAPVNWKQTLEQPETQQALARNVFRRVVLGL
jgi:hypothetical protein